MKNKTILLYFFPSFLLLSLGFLRNKKKFIKYVSYSFISIKKVNTPLKVKADVPYPSGSHIQSRNGAFPPPESCKGIIMPDCNITEKYSKLD